MIAVSSGTCVGINALLPLLGEKRLKGGQPLRRQRRISGLRQLSCICPDGHGSHLFFASQTENREIVEFGTQYLTICLIFSFGIFME